MLKKRVYLGLITGAVVAVLLGLLFNREREPEYEGKRLSYWVVIMSGAFRHRPVVDTRNSELAIRTIGTNGLPYLLRWLQYETPPWRTKLSNAVNPILNRLHPAWQLDDDATYRGWGSVSAIHFLGPSAEAIVGELGKTLNEPKGLVSAQRAALALGGIGTAGLPPLLQCLTNSMVNIDFIRRSAIFSIGDMGTNARLAFPIVRRFLNDPDPQTGLNARNALRWIGPEEVRKIGRGEERRR